MNHRDFNHQADIVLALAVGILIGAGTIMALDILMGNDMTTREQMIEERNAAQRAELKRLEAQREQKRLDDALVRLVAMRKEQR